MWESLHEAGTVGSEGGIVSCDEEYKKSCRITLEKCKDYYAITCGIYGAMLHTAFADFENYQDVYNEMKIELQTFLDSEHTAKEEPDFYDYFCRKF